jgi:hypothetical protein
MVDETKGDCVGKFSRGYSDSDRQERRDQSPADGTYEHRDAGLILEGLRASRSGNLVGARHSIAGLAGTKIALLHALSTPNGGEVISPDQH